MTCFPLRWKTAFQHSHSPEVKLLLDRLCKYQILDAP